MGYVRFLLLPLDNHICAFQRGTDWAVVVRFAMPAPFADGIKYPTMHLDDRLRIRSDLFEGFIRGQSTGQLVQCPPAETIDILGYQRE